MGAMDDTGRLIDQARAGDRAAFEALFGPLIDPACQLAFTFLHDWEEAEDTVQDACLKAWRAMVRLRDDTVSVRAWFLTIVVNEARSRRRGRWWSLIRVADPGDRPGARSLEDDVALGHDLDRAMTALSADQRTLLFLYFHLDLPLEEVGRVLGISEQAAKSRLYRATRKMRPAMTVEGVQP